MTISFLSGTVIISITDSDVSRMSFNEFVFNLKKACMLLDFYRPPIVIPEHLFKMNIKYISWWACLAATDTHMFSWHMWNSVLPI